MALTLEAVAGRYLACVVALLLAGCGSPHWSVPLPALDRVPLSVTQPGARDVWAVGGALGSGGDALVLHYDGASWQRFDVGTDATLWWVAEASADTVWAVGEHGTVLVGPPFMPVSVPATATLYGVWGTPGEAWVVGGEPDLSGVVLHQDQAGWHDLTPAGSMGAFFKVWGARADDVWICGQAGALLHWDGSALTPVSTGLGRATPLLTVAGRGSNDVYAVGGLGNAVVLHYDGATWTPLSDPLLDEAPGLAGVSVDADGTAFLVGASGTKLRGRSGAWQNQTAEATRVDLHAVSIRDGEVFAVGGNYQAPPPAARQGVVAHYGGEVSSTVR